MGNLRFFNMLLCSLVLLASSAHAQKLKTSPFQQVEVPRTVMSQLNALVHEEDKTAATENPMYITNLLATNDIQYKDGIYYFRVMSPHALGRIFITYKGQATVFKSLEVNGLLQEYLAFLSKSELPDKVKIDYLKAISIHLERQYKAEQH